MTHQLSTPSESRAATCRRRPSLGRALSVAVGLGLLATSPAAAQDDAGFFAGDIMIGYRYVDVDGAHRKYDEDYNVQEGPRLFDFRIDFAPAGETRELLDRLIVDFDTYGGDSFESLHLSAQRYGRWDLRYDRTKSDYFYEDVIVPHDQASVSLSTGGDFHHFDLERVRDRAKLDLRLTADSKLTFGFDRFAKTGLSTTTIDIQRDEFEFEKPVDETMEEYVLGYEHTWGPTTVVLEERIRDYENLYEIFLPGASIGENTTNLTELDFFFLDQPYDYRSHQHTLRLNSRPTRRLLLSGAASLEDLDLDLEADERSEGVGFNGLPFTTDLSGEGEIERETELFDLDATFLLDERLALVGGAHRRSLDQDGELEFGTDNLGQWEIDSLGAEVGLQVAVSADLTVTGGVLWEEREVAHAAGEGELGEVHEETTEHTGWFLRAGWRPIDKVRLDASIEDSSYDDPFTLVSPTDRFRVAVKLRYDFGGGLFADAQYLSREDENDANGWQATQDQARARVGWRRDRLEASLSYAAIDIDRDVVQLVSYGGLLRPYPIDYDAESDFLDASVRWRQSDRLAFGAQARMYDNEGSFALARDDLRGFVELGILDSYRLRLALRQIDYDEDAASFDDYDATIAEIGVGYRW